MKAVSEVIGNLLMLTVLVLTISVILVYGIPVIEYNQNTIRMRNIISQMVSASEQVTKVSVDVTPTTTIKIALSDGTLDISNDNNLLLFVNNSSGVLYSINEPMGKIEYIYKLQKIAIENGGVWSNDNAIINPPRISVSDGNVAIALVKIQGSGSVSGRGFANLEIKYNSSETRIFNTSGYVKMEIDSEYSEAWNRYFENMRGFVNNTVLQTELNDTKLNVSIYYDKLVLTRYVLDAWVKT
jgi:hypothetical protein